LRGAVALASRAGRLVQNGVHDAGHGGDFSPGRAWNSWARTAAWAKFLRIPGEWPGPAVSAISLAFSAVIFSR